jgi:hypothetical protein
MGKEKPNQLLFEDFEFSEIKSVGITLNKEKFIEILSEISSLNNLFSIKGRILELKSIILNFNQDKKGILNIHSNGDTVSFRKDLIISELDKIIETHSIERAKYYIKRLLISIINVKTNKINDINLSRWKEYDEIITDSLWILDKRDNSGAHLGWYWGNFIPQIPHQIMLRYTKKGDWILDAFVGSGTTLIECRRLGRNGIGLELNKEVALKAKELIQKQKNEFNIISEIFVGDSRFLDLNQIISKFGISNFQLLIMHPPYFDIIKFSNYEEDLSNSKDLEDFLEKFGKVINNVTPFLEKKRYFALVVGDIYSKGEWIPLGFYCMQEVLKRGYLLKSIVVKNFEETRGKRNQKELWRYRALVGGFYVFKHEYILIFQKK